MPKHRNDHLLRLEDRLINATASFAFFTLSTLVIGAWCLYSSLHYGPEWYLSNDFNIPLNTLVSVGEWFVIGLSAGSGILATRRIIRLLREIKALLQ